MTKELNCKIIRNIAVLVSFEKGWQTELNEISWNGDRPKFDIRRWNAHHDRCSKGITLTREETINLLSALQKELN